MPGILRSRLDIGRIRPVDEEYWHRYKATPKAFISLAKGQELWGSRFGKLTALRIAVPAGKDLQTVQSQFSQALLRQLNPQSAGFTLSAVRDRGLAASQGSTDFGEYFVYFSFFLIAAAILLAALFFRLMIEQRVREIGILRACGFSTALLQRNFFYEGALLSIIGSILGLLGSIIYGWLMVFGLRTWWTDAVGTRRIFLHISWMELLIGCLCGVVFSMASLAWTLRTLRTNSPRMLLTGILESVSVQKRTGSHSCAHFPLRAVCGPIPDRFVPAGESIPASGLFRRRIPASHSDTLCNGALPAPRSSRPHRGERLARLYEDGAPKCHAPAGPQSVLRLPDCRRNIYRRFHGGVSSGQSKRFAGARFRNRRFSFACGVHNPHSL